MVPSGWRDGGRLAQLERVYTTGYELVVEPVALNGNFHLFFYPRLGRRLRAFAPDVVHIDEEPYNFATFQALWLARAGGARTLWFTWQNLNRRYPWPFRLIERYTLSYADYGIAGSAGAAAVWREKGFTGSLTVIPQFGVDPEIYSLRAGDKESKCDFAIGYAGRLVPEKGVDVLLRAVAGIDGPWRVTIMGAGPEQERLRALAHDLGLVERVSFEEWLPSLKVPAFYRNLDVLVLPSRSRPNWVEQFGRVLIEAMACGVAVVGSDCGEIPGVIGDAGLIFPEGDVDELRRCLVQLMDSAELRADLAVRGRERVLAQFTRRRLLPRRLRCIGR